MKKLIIALSLAAGSGLMLGGCSDFLDSDYIFDERMTIEDVFSDKDYTNRWLAKGYAFLSSDYLQVVCSKKKVPFNFADDMYYGDGGYEDWKYARYDESGVGEKNSQYIWQDCYKGIRQVSILLQNIDQNEKLTEEEKNDMKGQAHFLRAYFYWLMIRSYGPVPLIGNDGIIDYTKAYDEIAQPRDSYDDCVEYIVKECEAAAPILPLTRSAQELTRPTRGAALALRARVLLYAASPLYNGGAPVEVLEAMKDRQGNPLISSTYEERKWARAAAAAKDVMDLKQYDLHTEGVRTETGDISKPATLTPQPDPVNHFDENPWPNGYKDIDPFESYRSVFNGSVAASLNEELIFTRGQNQGAEGVNVMVLHQLPRSEGGGYNSHGMTQKQCDAYYMKDGSDCPGMNDMYIGREGYTDPLRYNDDSRPTDLVTEETLSQYPELGAQGVGVCKQYAGREPRFYASVGYNGSTWNLLQANSGDHKGENQNVQIFYYRDKPDGYQTSTYWLRTGIGIKKFVHPNDISNTEETNYDQSRLTDKVPTDIRYAEVLLIYAEALNELTTSHEVTTWDGRSYSIARDKAEMKKGIWPIRIRAGVPDYEESIYDDPDKFRIKLKRERQIELFAEGHRYFDLRRWCDAPTEEPAPVYGCNIYCTEAMSAGFHTPTVTTSLPSIFTTKMWFWPINHDEMKKNKELTQNPGWTDPE